MNGIQKTVESIEMGNTWFTVDRLVLTRQYDTRMHKERKSYRASGCVQEAEPEEAKLTVAEYHGQKILRFYTLFPLTSGEVISTGPSYRTADRIHLNGKTYRVLRTWSSKSDGYTKAWAEEMEQEPEDD